MFEITEAFFWQVFFYINLFILFYFCFINLSYLVLVITSFFYIKRQYKTLDVHKLPELFSNKLYPSYSILVTVYNEGEDMLRSLNSLLHQEFGDFEVIVINDGSTDNTLELLKDTYQLFSSDRHISKKLPHEPIKGVYLSKTHPQLVVIDKENGHKGDAMNAGLNAARKQLYCGMDGDSILEPDVLKKMLRSFVENQETIAAGGIVRVGNGCTFEHGTLKKIETPSSFIETVQVIEYIRAFLLGRTGWEYFNGLLIISGAFGVFDRETVEQVGGYDTNSITEDFDLMMRLHQYCAANNLDDAITFQPEPVCWTDVPVDWSKLGSQRNRWQRGLLQTLWKYKSMTFNPKYGFVGLVAVPFYIFFELLGPVIELFGYLVITILLLTGLLPPVTGLLFFIVAILFGVLLSVVSVMCDELTYHQYPAAKDTAKILLVSIFESFGYRQLHTWWRCRGMVEYIFGNRDWSLNRFSTSIVNTLHWIAFIFINIIIVYLFYYGITEGGQWF